MANLDGVTRYLVFGTLFGPKGIEDTLKTLANSVIRIKYRCIILFCTWFRMENVNDAESVLQILEALKD